MKERTRLSFHLKPGILATLVNLTSASLKKGKKITISGAAE